MPRDPRGNCKRNAAEAGAWRGRGMNTMRVGFVGWRGMVGSVLLSRMLEERDFARLDPVFYSTSAVGGAAPPAERPGPPARPAGEKCYR